MAPTFGAIFFASLTTPPTAALLQQTRTIPVVFTSVNDPIGSGFVASFARPGGNATGFIILEPTISGKWLEMLKEIAPHLHSIAFLFNPAQAPTAQYYLNSFRAAALSMDLEPSSVPVKDVSDIETAMVTTQTPPMNGGVLVVPDGFYSRTAWRSSRWRLGTACLLFIHTVNSLRSVVYCLMGPMRPTVGGERPAMWIASSGVRL
ncbi:hypothetical protein IVB38_18535 [Bradyrhizobium sp. 38]|uniref:ABC transporter substrate binding protein n=1 Tax=unclassified Bradyrhizobium TaxID=2631580 RepID=UPI001FF81063|nr:MULTISPECIES: ABC transporter substrate binding protein [unclassified Bradyrhizobium]MCK1337961.1 hypothetical protein [Bradyrhizobium sp. 38]MCK1780399.1 hypothetical protein [Bradyrhizobium sp. 132]